MTFFIRQAELNPREAYLLLVIMIILRSVLFSVHTVPIYCLISKGHTCLNYSVFQYL